MKTCPSPGKTRRTPPARRARPGRDTARRPARGRLAVALSGDDQRRRLHPAEARSGATRSTRARSPPRGACRSKNSLGPHRAPGASRRAGEVVPDPGARSRRRGTGRCGRADTWRGRRRRCSRSDRARPRSAQPRASETLDAADDVLRGARAAVPLRCPGLELVSTAGAPPIIGVQHQEAAGGEQRGIRRVGTEEIHRLRAGHPNGPPWRSTIERQPLLSPSSREARRARLRRWTPSPSSQENGLDLRQWPAAQSGVEIGQRTGGGDPVRTPRPRRSRRSGAAFAGEEDDPGRRRARRRGRRSSRAARGGSARFPRRARRARRGMPVETVVTVNREPSASRDAQLIEISAQPGRDADKVWEVLQRAPGRSACLGRRVAAVLSICGAGNEKVLPATQSRLLSQHQVAGPSAASPPAFPEVISSSTSLGGVLHPCGGHRCHRPRASGRPGENIKGSRRFERRRGEGCSTRPSARASRKEAGRGAGPGSRRTSP